MLLAPNELEEELQTVPEQFHRMWSQRYYPGVYLSAAWDGPDIVGFIFMRAIDRRTLFLDYLFVSQSHQRQGIAQQLQDNALKALLLTHPDIQVIQLKVYKTNTNAVEYYLRRGFSIISESEKRFTMEKREPF